MVKISNYLKQNGQGIVEYALLLAFVVGIAMMLNGSNLGAAVKNTFDTVASYLSGEEQNAYFAGLKKWGKAREFNPDTQAERLAIDQLALENLAGFFLGKDRAYITSLMKKGYDGTSSNGILLGHYGYDGNNSFFMSTNNNDQLISSDNVFNWMQGDYGTYDSTTMTVSGYKPLAYDTSYRQLVSDYPVQNPYLGNNVADGNDARGGVKIKLQYDSPGPNGKVVAARVAVDKGSQQKTVGTLTNATTGLEVTVRSDGSKEVTSGFKNF